MDQLSPYVMYPGTCEAAFKFYEQAVGAKILELSTYAGTPMGAHVPPDWQNKVLHARIHVLGITLMGSDHTPDHYKAPQGFHLAISEPDPSQAERFFHALAPGGNVQMPIQETPWAIRFGMLSDQFGIPWMVNCDRPKASH